MVCAGPGGFGDRAAGYNGSLAHPPGGLSARAGGGRGRLGTAGYSNVIGFDDGPFPREHRGEVPVVGTVYAGARLDGVLVTRVRRDGDDATERLAAALAGSRFREHAGLVLLQGIALAGFNVVDIHALRRSLGRPVLVVTRAAPDLERVRHALLERVPGGEAKWAAVRAAGPMEPLEGLWAQRAGITREQAAATLARHCRHGRLPEPLRTAHLIAGALVTGESRGGA